MPISGQTGWFEKAHLLYWLKMLAIFDQLAGMMNGKQMLWALGARISVPGVYLARFKILLLVRNIERGDRFWLK